MAGQKKAIKIKRALKTATRLRLPVRISAGRGSGRAAMAPMPGEIPIIMLRIQVLGCSDLLAKDKSGTSDAFVVVSFARNRSSTPVCRKTLNPTYPAKDATFEFPVYLSLAGSLGVLELIVWDKDMIKKDYLGEASIPLEHWFGETNANAKGFDDLDNRPFSVNMVSSRASKHVSGTIQVKMGFTMPKNVNHTMNFDEVYDALVRRSRSADLSILSAPPTEGIGTIRSHEVIAPAYEDDGLSSDEGEQEISDEEYEERYDDVHALGPLPQTQSPLTVPIPLAHDIPTHIHAEQSAGAEEEAATPTASPPTPSVAVVAPSPVSSTQPPITGVLPSPPVSAPSPHPPAPLIAPKPSKSSKLPRVFQKRPSLPPSLSSESGVGGTPGVLSGASSPAANESRPPTPVTPGGKRKFHKGWKRPKGDYNLNAANDILGIVLLEIQGATDLPKLKNLTRTTWDMDPFVVISFGKKVFRTRVIRHTLNPVWDEKLIFQVRRYEAAFKVQLNVLDWDKITSNDYICDASFDVSELLDNAPKKDEATGLYPEHVAKSSNDIQEFKLKLSSSSGMPWEAKHAPVLTIRAKYQPYDALRQQFWRQYLKQYDTDENGLVSHLEITSMLDSLGSTLSGATIDGFFTKHGKQPRVDELTYDEAIQCLEEELCRPQSEKKRLNTDDSAAPDTSTPATPMLLNSSSEENTPGMKELELENIDFSGPHVHPTAVHPASTVAHTFLDEARRVESIPLHLTEPSQQPLSHAANANTSPNPSAPEKLERQLSEYSEDGAEESSSSNSAGEDSFERVINVKNCPLCHKPRLNSRAEVDIVTHLAICASQDWARMDRIMVSNFVTASQAQRKWYTKVISKVSSGNYKLGANSANIIVQNRMTGQLEEEKMQVYVRLGIRLLYKGAKGRMEGARARRLLKSLSVKQGIKYDSPESANDIPAFIQFHKLNVDELLDPLDSFKNFNEFFYRKLKSDARPVEEPENPHRLVSAADCRMMAFETVNEATKLWIKGREFTVARLLGDAYRSEVDKYTGGALCIFRLAPQDYHRFHSPVDGTIGPMTYIAGEYYTVNPQAIRTTLDVYGENARKIVPIDSPVFGRVMAVCVGAMMVGSIKTTVQEGEEVKRGQEFGYFAFGGSTIVCLFERGVVEWDEDLLLNGRASLETLVRVGMGIGRARRPHTRHGERSSSRSKSPSASHSPALSSTAAV